LTIPISGRLEAEKRRAGAEHAAELMRVAATEIATRARVKTLWAEWSAAKLRVELLEKLVGQLGEISGVTDKLVKAGAVTRAEGRLLTIERATRQAEQSAAALRMEELRSQLHAVMGLVPEAGVLLVAGLEMPRVMEGEDFSRMPAVAVSQAEYEMAERVLEREVQAQFPDVTIGPGGGRDEGDRRVILGLQFPLPLWNRNVQAVAEAGAARILAGEQLRSVIASQTFALKAARLQLEGARKQREILETAIIPAVDEQVEEIRKVAALGEADGMLLLDAVRRQYEAKVRVIETRVEEIRAAAKLSELLGDGAGVGDAK
jgi:cobalt-zinc-cadmium efflux system outer membrane protein